MILQVVSCDFSLHEYFLYLAYAPLPPPTETQKALRIKKAIGVVRSDSIIGVLSSQLMMLALGNQIREMLTLHTNPHAVHGSFTLKDDYERQFCNGPPFRELKERMNDRCQYVRKYKTRTRY